MMPGRGKYDLQKHKERSHSLQDMVGTYRSGVPAIHIERDLNSDNMDEVFEDARRRESYGGIEMYIMWQSPQTGRLY